MTWLAKLLPYLTQYLQTKYWSGQHATQHPSFFTTNLFCLICQELPTHKKMFLNFPRHNCFTFWLEQACSSNFCTSCFCPENIWQTSPAHMYSCSNFDDLQMQNMIEKRQIRLISYLPKEIVWWGEEFSSCDTCFLVTWHGCSYGVRKREEELNFGLEGKLCCQEGWWTDLAI